MKISLAMVESHGKLRPLRGLVVIDEVQLRPDLYPVLRVLGDRHDLPARFLILGSASGDLLRQTSESLAGRMERLTMGGFSLAELGSEAEELHPNPARAIRTEQDLLPCPNP